jgi:hypothetical protein
MVIDQEHLHGFILTESRMQASSSGTADRRLIPMAQTDGSAIRAMASEWHCDWNPARRPHRDLTAIPAAAGGFSPPPEERMMACEDKQEAFNARFAEVRSALEAELQAITSDTEARAQAIADDFDAANDLAEGVGASAGTAMGGMLGPGGAVVGGVIGKTIGALFTLEVGMHRHTVSLDVPQVTMETQDLSFDLPTVVMRDTDISFDLPVIEMRRQEGPPKPEMTVRWEQRCVLGMCTDVPVPVVTWTPTYLDVPVTVMRTQRIVIGLPQVEMRRQDIRLDLPVITMRTTEFSADVPYITLRFIQDAGKRTSALAAAVAQSAQDAANQKQLAFKQRLRSDVAPVALEMFACFRQQIGEARSAAASRFGEQVQNLTLAVAAIVGRGVPEDHAELTAARAALAEAVARQAEALRPFDESLARLDESSKAAMAQFLGAGEEAQAPKGGLATVPDRNAPRMKRLPGILINYATGRPSARSLTSSMSRAQAKGLYLTIGLNQIDPAAYGNSGDLMGCENDARDVAALAARAGITGTTLLTRQATSAAVLAEMARAAAVLETGDLFLVGYSGHGGQVGDVSGEETDGLDETWCLYDRQLVDDELYAMWAKFRPGVRIVVLSDSCHSGTVTRALIRNMQYAALNEVFTSDAPAIRHFNALGDTDGFAAPVGRVKALPFEVSWQNYLDNKSVYDSVQLIAGPSSKAVIGATIILISGCQDNQLSLDGTDNGVFTGQLKRVWNDGGFAGNYGAFKQAIGSRMPITQTPNYTLEGAANPVFEAQRPFTI